MNEADTLSTHADLSLISADIAIARLKGSEFEMEQATRRYVNRLRTAVDKGFDKKEARRLLTDLASDDVADCAVCVDLLDRERENLS